MLDLFQPPKVPRFKRRPAYNTPRYSVSRAKLTPEERRAKKAARMRRYRAAARTPVTNREVV